MRMTTQSKHPLLRHARAALVVALLLFAVPVLAVLEDYAWQWPLHTGGADGLLALSLQAPVYERISRADLRDLAAFNRAGEPIPLGPAAQPQQRARLLQAEPREVPMFAVGREASAGSDGDAVSLRIRRNADGTLTQLDAQVEPAAGADAGRDLLLDLSRWKQPVTALLLQLDETRAAAQPLNARVAVHGSSDLGSWRLLADSLAVVSLQEGGFRLQRLRLELPATGLDYLRIR